MQRLSIAGRDSASEIYVGEHLEKAGRYLPRDSRVVVITDENVNRLYGDKMPQGDRIVIGMGEKVKTLETAAFIYRRLIDLEADRGVFLLGVGGGIVCDITGFVAATYLRGVRFANVATTLLAQVDASVGGKTGVNLDGYKNMVGVFYQPRFVICDPALLDTLPQKEIASGFAEIVKHAAIADASYFKLLEDRSKQLFDLAPDLMEHIIYQSVVIKADIVNRDERETGQRRKLNFGHTLGHAFEKTLGVSHGQGVSAGMAAAAGLSVKKGLLCQPEADRLEALLKTLGLPVSLSADPGTIYEALARDKKRRDEFINFVLLTGIGTCVVTPVSLGELREMLGA
jgi:3-dehydroquinate synthase